MKYLTPQARVFIVLSVCLMSLAIPARAYQVGDWTWNPTLSVDETYDSNVTFAAHDEKNDFITAIAPGLEGVFEGKTQYAKLKGNLHEKLYADNTEFNNFSQDLSGLYKQEFSKYDRLTLKDAFLHADQTSSFDDEFGKVSGRYDFYKNYFDGDYAHDFSEQLTGELLYHNEYYEPRLEGLPKTVQNKIGLQTNYALSSQTIPFWFYEYSHRDFSPGGTISRNSTGVGAKHYLTEQMYINGKIGADFISPIGGKDITKPQYLIGITDEPDQTTVYGVSFTKYYEDSSYDQNLLNSWRFSLNWGKQLLERLQGVLTAFTGSGKFEPEGSKESLDGIGLVFHYDATSNSVISAGYAYTNKNSSDDTRDYQKNTISLNYKIKF